jgi:hypothetical protein
VGENVYNVVMSGELWGYHAFPWTVQVRGRP